MHARKITIIFASSTLLLGGCIDYGVETRRLSLAEVPDKVLAAFVRSSPNCAIESVEVYTHRISTVGYRVHYRLPDGSLKQKSYSKKGEEVFEPAKTSSSSQVGSRGDSEKKVK